MPDRTGLLSRSSHSAFSVADADIQSGNTGFTHPPITAPFRLNPSVKLPGLLPVQLPVGQDSARARMLSSGFIMLARLVAAVLIACAVSVAAQVPVPRALLEATTVYVVNAGVHERILNNTLKALKKIPRWTVVADAADADLTLTVSDKPTKQIFNFATGRAYPINTWFLAITAKDGTSVYGVQFRGNPEKELATLQTRLAAE